MDNIELKKLLEETKILPVVVIDRKEDAVPTADALREGGINVAEITFRTACAAEVIKTIAKERPGFTLGAGTVLDVATAKEAVSAGAEFIVCPGLCPEVVEFCQKESVPVIPGVMTPSEITKALSLGLDVLKFFPAEAAGGVKMVKALAGPFKGVSFLPTGGIDETNLKDYLSLRNVIACGGSFMVKKEYLSDRRFDLITNACKTAREGI